MGGNRNEKTSPGGARWPRHVGSSLIRQLLYRFALILLGVVMLIGVLQAFSLRRAMLGQLQDLLESRLHNVPIHLLASSDTAEAVARNAEELMRALVDRDVTVQILDASGNRLADSEVSIRTWYNERLLPLERGPDHLDVPDLGVAAYREMVTTAGFPATRIVRMTDGEEMVIGFSKLGRMNAPAGLLQLSVSAEEAEALVWRQMLVYLALAVAALVLGGLLASRVLRRTLDPLRKLNEAVEAQDAASLERRIAEDAGQEEVDRLSHAYNRMLERLQEAFALERIQRDRMQRFLSDVAHELKTPLTSIHGFAEVLLMGAAEDKAQTDEALGIIRSESGRLGELVQSLLDLAGLEQGGTLSREPGDLAALVRSMQSQLQLLAGKRDVMLDLPEAAPCRFAQDRIRQVVLNLFQNAVTHTDPEQGRIRIAIREAEREGRIGHLLTVGDNGCGIAPEQIDRVFDRFWRADRHRSRRSGGNGLGLAIVQTIVGLHGGVVQVQSEVVKGTNF